MFYVKQSEAQKKMKSEFKLCKDCDNFFDEIEGSYCRMTTGEISLVTGEKVLIYTKAPNMRATGPDKCGPAAKFFVPRRSLLRKALDLIKSYVKK
jgi:hypothetical protein